jgi:ubiquinone biosynthesis protein
MSVTNVARTIRNVRRYSEIIEVLVRNGFEDVVGHFGLDRLLARGSRLLGRTPAPLVESMSRPARMRVVFEELGPTFMKLGQMLSTRRDLVPDEWADEFAKLQASGPRLPFPEIQAVLAREFEGRERDLFASIDEEPLAAASMAQVHRARLGNGTPIVLKVLRPGTEERTQSDLEILQTLATFVESRFAISGFHPTDVVREFARELKREVDFTYEGRSTERLGEAFADDPTVRFPKVYWEATTRRVLALEEFDGILLSRLREGDLDAEQRSQVVGRGATAVARQCLEIGLFHADPHPGNLFALVQPDGSVVAGFIDCGMTGRLEPRMREDLARLVKAIADSNVDDAIAVAGRLADVPPRTLDDPVFRADMAELVQSFEVRSVAQFDLPGLLQQLFATMRSHNIRFPAQLILLIKALTTIEGVGRAIDPGFDLVGHLRPSIERAVRQQYGWRALRRRVQRGAEQYLSLAEELPHELQMLLGAVRRRNFAVQLQHRGLDRLTRTIEHASRNIGFGFIVTGLTVSSAILVHASEAEGRMTLRVLGLAGFLFAGVLALAYLASNRKWLAERRAEGDGE